MFIRRNMSSNVSYQQLKEYECFKQLGKVIDILVLKQILPMVVKKVSLDTAKQTHNRKKMIYIPEDNYECCKEVEKNQGSAISGTVIDLISKTSSKQPRIRFFMIENKIYNILKYVFHKKIDCMDHLKSFEKLNFLYRSELDQIPFGGYIYRKDDKIQSIYYLVQGQIKITKTVDEKEISICNIYEGSFFGLYEFGKNKTKRLLNAQSTSNSNIVLSFSLDMLTQLFGKDESEVLKKMLQLPSQIEKTMREENRKLSLKKKKEKKNFYIKAYEFQRRLNKFSQERTIDRSESAFGKFLYNKSLLFKIKDSNDLIPRLKPESIKIESNFHKNEATSKYYKRLNQHRLYNLDSTILKIFNDKENAGCEIPALYKPSQLLTCRLKQRCDTGRQQFTSSAMGQIKSVRKALVEQTEDIQQNKN